MTAGGLQGVVGLSMYSLAIPHLWEEWAQLRRGGLYWLTCERADEAVRVCRQLLDSLSAAQKAILLTRDLPPATLLADLPASRGPGELWPVELLGRDPAAALRVMARDLQRRCAPRRQLLLLLAPSASWDAFDERALRDWCARLAAWLAQRECTLLVCSHGEPQGLVARLLPCNEALAGLAQLYHGRGSLHYLLHFWRNDLAVRAGGEVALVEDDGRLCCRPETERGSPGPASSDLQRCLAARAVLEGAPPLSEHWQLFDDDASLLAAALQASAASVILRIDSNAQVGELARQIYLLRRQRGRALKVLVRELSPCLRYLDEQLLLVCGASLIVPYGTALSRFLTQLDSLQGQSWNRVLPDDFETTLRQLRPPPLRGVLSAGAFRRAVGEIFAAGQYGEVSHLLLRLQPVAGLSLAQILGQCRLRRYGDLACVAGGVLYLFLFACRSNALESALGNIFRLPWRELFVAHAQLHEVREIPADDTPPPRALQMAPATPPAEAAAAPRLSPQRVRLGPGRAGA